MEEPEVPTEHLQEEIHDRVSHHGERWTLGVALTSALLASLAAVGSMSGGHYATESMTCQIEAANQWTYFQSKSIKESQLKSKMELLEALGRPHAQADENKAAEYAHDKEQIQKKAEDLAKESKHFLHTHHILSRSVTMFQIAIAVGAISVLTRRRPFWFVSLTFGAIGLLLAGQAFLSLAAR
jgi:hypothetical protein